MNKDEILSRSRQENKDRDLYEAEVSLNAGNAASLTAILLATVFFVTQLVVGGGWNLGFYAIVFSIGATNFVIKAVRLKRKRYLLLAIVYTLITVILSVFHLLGVMTKSLA